MRLQQSKRSATCREIYTAAARGTFQLALVLSSSMDYLRIKVVWFSIERRAGTGCRLAQIRAAKSALLAAVAGSGAAPAPPEYALCSPQRRSHRGRAGATEADVIVNQLPMNAGLSFGYFWLAASWQAFRYRARVTGAAPGLFGRNGQSGSVRPRHLMRVASSGSFP
jgi:hypothetical protein